LSINILVAVMLVNISDIEIWHLVIAGIVFELVAWRSILHPSVNFFIQTSDDEKLSGQFQLQSNLSIKITQGRKWKRSF